jgi:hypothetical protein
MTYEEKAKDEMSEHNNLSMTDCAILLGMAYIADSIQRGFKRLAKVVDDISIEVQDES